MIDEAHHPLDENFDDLKKDFANKILPQKTNENNKNITGNDNFRVDDSGVYYLQTDKDGEPLPDLWLCSRIDVEARTRNAEGLNHGKLLVFKDADNRIHQWAIPMELLAGDGTDYRRNLLSMGVQISSNRKAREKLTEYLLITVPQKTVLCADKLGWYGNVFVFPEEVIGSKDISEDVLFQSSTINISGFKTKGTLEDWKDNIAKYCVGNSRLVLAVSTAFAAPLLNFTRDESGGVHFKGASSGGKTTTLKIACTVWGEPSRLEQWRATSNGLEGIATKYNDSLLCLDELSQIDPREAGEVAYMLANGSGKNRSKKDGALRKKTGWRILFCSSGESGLAEHMRQLGKEAKAGQQVRILEIPADAGCDLGIFENLHGFVSGAEFAQYLNRQVDLYYGTPIREFLKSITAGDVALLVKNIERLKDDFIRDLSIENTDGQVKRAASRFALIAAAGELATSIGITGWTNGEAINAVKLCFHNWLSDRGGTGQYEEKQITSQIMEFFQRNSQSRFFTWRSGLDTQDNLLSETAMSAVVINKAGFVRIEGNAKTFFVETEVFRNELCRGYSSKQVAKICIKNGWLIPDSEGSATTVHRMPDTGKIRRMYQFTDKVLGGEDAG